MHNYANAQCAEAHGKYLVVREAIGAAVPSAGVGCAFARAALEQVAQDQGGLPFDPGCLTEDYELGLRIGAHGGRGVFIRMRDDAGDLVCTREYFPATLTAAVRQKARWMTGIALAGWDRLGWQGSLAERWMRFRDRRGPLAAVILCCAYAAILLFGVTEIARLVTGTKGAPFPPVLTLLLTCNALLMVWRMAVRGIFASKFYGWREAVRSAPRAVLANIIAIMAARRAMLHYIRISRGKMPVWEKTTHHFPEEFARQE
ncbi:MAG TPA: glycosyltransferase family 2 protein [Rhizorhapis sp.]